MKGSIHKLYAEFFGTFAIVFFGCGAIAIAAAFDQPEVNKFVPIIFGGTVAMMIYAVGHISGAHFNPAVTVAFAATRHFGWASVIPYIIAQLLGAVAACWVLYMIVPDISTYGPTTPHVHTTSAIIVEFILTFFLMLVVMAVATDDRAPASMAGAAVGVVVAIDAFVGGPLTGASMNPARTFGPALFSQELGTFWIYLVGPFAGALVAAVFYEQMRGISKKSYA